VLTKSTAASDVIWGLNEGNKRYLSKSTKSIEMGNMSYNLVDKFIEDPLRSPRVQAVVCADAHCKHAVSGIFDTEPGELHVMRMSGSVISEGDGMVGTILEQPSADFRKLGDFTSQFQTWTSIDALLCSSRLIAERVAKGEMELHGADLHQLEVMLTRCEEQAKLRA